MDQKNKKVIIMVGIIIIVQTIIFIIAGINKAYIHMDEAFSLGLASYNKMNLQDNDDFYNTWHNKEYYEDYLVVNKNEKFMFSQVYENQKNDVHPPLYYLILRIAMEFSIDKYSKWTGIIINIIIYFFITIFMYLITSKLLEGKEKHKQKAAMLTLMSSLTLSSLTNVLYTRMYALLTLNIVITTYLHIKLLNENGRKNINLISIGIFALLGSLTHYYYLIYLATLVIMFVIKYIKEKQLKQLGKYLLVIIVAAVISLLVFPDSINHILFSYRGQGIIENLTNIGKYIVNIILYLIITNVYIFNNLLFFLLIGIVFIKIYLKKKQKTRRKTQNKDIKYIVIPTLVYFILVAIASPFIELRYILPISGLIFMILFYYIESILEKIVKEKIVYTIILAVFLMMCIMPILSNKIIDKVVWKEDTSKIETTYSSKIELVENLKSKFNLPISLFTKFTDIPVDNILLYIRNFKIEPEVIYSNKDNLMKRIKGDLNNVPAIYLLNSKKDRFLDDILLFANIKESYIAKDIQCSEKKVSEILTGKETTNGILILINDGQENEKLIEMTKKAANLYNVTYLQRLNMCDIYYIK